ncbi:MAG: TraR/DksA C4-type zinc finger protein [bacterium]|nr:TraR/DksA C4-type zinc finger protein [bacterium]
MVMINEELKKEFKEKLETEKAKLEEELGKFAKPTENPSDFETQFENIGTDRDENATEVENYSDSVALENNLEEQLRNSINALEKMKNGSYGICENCDKEIDIERLKAYPAAKTCVECK